MITPTRQAVIRDIAYHFPEQELTNDALAEAFPDWPAKKISDTMGIRSRRVARPDQCSSDLGVAAAEKLFVSGVCRPEDIDFLLFCTQTPDYVMPSTACLVHERLGLRADCGAADLGLACSGWVYGMAMAKSMIESLDLRNLLLVTAETYSKLVHPRDRSARMIFGDGAAATLVTAVESDETFVGPFVFGTDGAGVSDMVVPRADGVADARPQRPSPWSMTTATNARSTTSI